MSELSREARAIIDVAQRAERPRPGDVARIRAAVLARVAAGPGPGPGNGDGGGDGGAGEGGSQAAGQGSTGSAAQGAPVSELATANTAANTASAQAAATKLAATKVVAVKAVAAKAAVAKILAATALAAGLGTGGVLWLTARDQPGPARNVHQSAQVSASAPVAASKLALVADSDAGIEIDPAIELEPQQPAAAEPGERAGERRPRARQPRAGTEAAGPAPASNLAQELALIDRAKAAFAAEGAGAALPILENHRSQFASGALAAEREWLRIRALCELERPDQARALARRFVKSWPNSPYTHHVVASCGGSQAAADDPDPPLE